MSKFVANLTDFSARLVSKRTILAQKKLVMNIRQQAQILLVHRYQRSKRRSRSISSRLAAKIGCVLPHDWEGQTELKQNV